SLLEGRASQHGIDFIVLCNQDRQAWPLPLPRLASCMLRLCPGRCGAGGMACKKHSQQRFVAHRSCKECRIPTSAQFAETAAIRRRDQRHCFTGCETLLSQLPKRAAVRMLQEIGRGSCREEV